MSEVESSLRDVSRTLRVIHQPILAERVDAGADVVRSLLAEPEWKSPHLTEEGCFVAFLRSPRCQFSVMPRDIEADNGTVKHLRQVWMTRAELATTPLDVIAARLMAAEERIQDLETSVRILETRHAQLSFALNRGVAV